jgi:RNA 3'-terminal phosphate cyclase (ATP)
VTLVLQAMLPAAVATAQRVHVRVRGGTDVPAAPPLDYLRCVMLPLLARIGVRAELGIERRGYYPRGGGAIDLQVQPAPALAPFVVAQLDTVRRIEIHAHVTRLARSIAERMVASARAECPVGVSVDAAIEVCADPHAGGPGGAIVLAAPSVRTTLGAGCVAERGVSAEQLGRDAARALARELQAGSTLDVHAADQLLVFLAMAAGESVFRTSRLSSHASTAMWLLRRLMPVRFDVKPAGDGVHLRVQP